jgi:hypothetical protein
MGVKLKGFNQLQKALNELADDVKNVSGEYSFEELFHANFMGKYTSVATFQELLDKSGFRVETAEDFKAIPDDAWDEHIRRYTSFSDWEDMQQTAAQELIAKKIGLK